MRKKANFRKKTAKRNRAVKELHAVPLESLLSENTDRLACAYAAEPELLFGGKQRCVDPRTGLAARGRTNSLILSRAE
jgi:hypothetical protein